MIVISGVINFHGKSNAYLLHHKYIFIDKKNKVNLK